MTVYRARAVHWAKGWELHVEGVGVTQVRVLDHAAQQVRDLVATMTGEDVPADAEVAVRVDLGGLEKRAEDARTMTASAMTAQLAAAEASRRVVADLRAAGVSVTDIATLMGISRGRVSQLA